MLKFLAFQEMYFNDDFNPEYGIKPRKELKNAPILVRPEGLKKYPEPGRPLKGQDMKRFIQVMSSEIARILNLEKRR